MKEGKTKTLKKIESRMKDLEPGTARYKALEQAKRFKISWMELGRALSDIWENKLFRDWGYDDFEEYTTKEVGVRKQTALKLLRSYAFLEKERPGFLSEENRNRKDPVLVPDYQAVDILRRANGNKDISRQEYGVLKEEVLERGKDAKEVRKQVEILTRNARPGPEEEKNRKKAVLTRLVGMLRSLVAKGRETGYLSRELLTDIEALIRKIQISAE